ncbi:SpoIIE family protein phosphatase [Roseomonas terrae]|jgi:sigma-B regulation protein RsbU (phosphoserine phosphatase)|uniref:SpoIIE family protein phosphatase n=1 Tax=Neoroseomonas terrae TaxID=424799 RepID=A0ABS5EEJ4_9PROT|nr:PP2C family protein-serine/threonine phosphatase [Neoroseomonas terrae]MBR0649444.1 SpoIIE family protein phosphatase [Neoroseomonas terrae]
MLLRSRIVLLAAVMAPVVAGAVAAPGWLLLREREARIGELTVARQAAIVEAETQRAARPLVDAARRIADDAALAAALARQDATAARARLAVLDGGGSRIEVIGRGGRVLLARPDDRGMEGMIDIAAVLREYAPGTGGSGIEPVAGNGGLRLVAFARGAGTDVVAVAMDAAPLLEAIGATLGGRALAADFAGRHLLPADPAAWDGIAPAIVSGATMPVDFRDGGRRREIVPTLLIGSNGVPVARLLVVQDASAAARRHDLVVLVAVLVLAGCILLAGIVLFRMLRAALEPLGDLAGVLHAIAGGDRLANATVDGRAEEIGRIARALEVLRSSGIALDRLETRERLARRRHLALIGGALARLVGVLETSERDAATAVLRRLEEGSGGLADAFQTMVEGVLNRHARLSELLAERTRDLELVRQALDQRLLLDRVVQELEVARRLQLDSLPSAFPVSPCFAIHAAMWPAKEVGGDFYDVLVLADGRVALMVGDASGKGVAAAIFVAMTRSLLRAAVSRGASPAEALAQANDMLAADNPTLMFATAFIALLDPASGLLRYANGGHNPPWLAGAAAQRALGGGDGIALGVVEGFAFDDREALLSPGDRLLLFTDGVTEADREDGSLFGDERLSATLASAADAPPEALVAHVAGAVADFAEGRPQADDITLLCLAYAGAGVAQAAE